MQPMWLCLVSSRQFEGTFETHSGEKTNKCNKCDFAFFYISTLRKHLKMHSGEKPNKCNHCDFASYQAGHLRAHLKTHSLLKCNSLIHFLSKVTICCQKLSKIDKCCQLLLSKDIICNWFCLLRANDQGKMSRGQKRLSAKFHPRQNFAGQNVTQPSNFS